MLQSPPILGLSSKVTTKNRHCSRQKIKWFEQSSVPNFLKLWTILLGQETFFVEPFQVPEPDENFSGIMDAEFQKIRTPFKDFPKFRASVQNF